MKEKMTIGEEEKFTKKNLLILLEEIKNLLEISAPDISEQEIEERFPSLSGHNGRYLFNLCFGTNKDYFIKRLETLIENELVLNSEMLNEFKTKASIAAGFNCYGRKIEFEEAVEGKVIRFRLFENQKEIYAFTLSISRIRFIACPENYAHIDNLMHSFDKGFFQIFKSLVIKIAKES